MNKCGKRIAALLFSVALLLSVFANAGIYVHAQAIDYLNVAQPKNTLKDSGSSGYTAVTTSRTVSGISGAKYDNGIEVTLKRDCDDKVSFVTLTYDVTNTAASFEGYVDIVSGSDNTENFAVTLEVFKGQSSVYTKTLMPSTQFPLKLDIPIEGGEEVSVRFGDTAPNTGVTSFVVGNAAFCETNASVPEIKAPGQSDNQNSNQNNQNDQETDLSADAQQLKQKSKAYLGHNYLLVTMQLSWEQAATWCEMQGGYLATITSESENKFLADYLRQSGNKTAYIGMSNDNEDNAFLWQNGETALYFNWARQNTAITGKSYVMIGGGSDEWTQGKADGQYLNFIIEWGEKAPLQENTQTDSKKAVIVIAGLGGSNLSDSDTDAVWATNSGGYVDLSLGNTATNKTGITVPGSDYGAGEVYRTLIEELEIVCSDSDIVLYEWDWRFNAADAVKNLDTVITNGGWDQVSLVCHNTGGLAACYYIKEKGADSIDKLVTLGTPFYGTEKAFYMMESGMFAQGVLNGRSTLANSVNILPSLYSLVPDEPNVGRIGLTGNLTETVTRKEALEIAGAELNYDKGTDSSALKKVYEMIQNGDIGGAYIIAGTGEPTVDKIVLEDRSISNVEATLWGDGLTDLDSAVMNFSTARPPYVIEDTDVAELVTNEECIKLICNILLGKGDTSDFSEGIEKNIYRAKPEDNGDISKISISGSGKLTVQSEQHTALLSGSSYSFTGGGQSVLMYGSGIKTIYVTDAAQIGIEIVGEDVCVEISARGKVRRWTDIEMGTGTVLKNTLGSDVLEVIKDPDGTGIEKIEADPVAEIQLKSEEKESKSESRGKKLSDIPWNVWTTLGLMTAAAVFALILMPYFAYRVSKVETDRRKRIIRKNARARRQQQNAMYRAPGISPAPLMPPAPAAMPQPQEPEIPQAGDVSFDIDDIAGEI